MTGLERLKTTLAHRQPDRVCVDFGSTSITGIHVAALTRLRSAVLGESGYRVKVIEPYQMLGEVDDALREALGIDVIGVAPPRSIFGTRATDWKPFKLWGGTEVLVSGDFNVTTDEHYTYMYPEGDLSVPPSGKMPHGGYFFDSIIRQEPVDDQHLDPEDNLEEFAPLTADDLAYFREQRAWLAARKDCGAVLSAPGTAFGDIALVPAPFLKHPKGIRDVEEWYISTVTRKDYVHEIFERQCEIAEKNLERLIDLFGDMVQVVVLTGTDFGMQQGLFISIKAYRELFQPFHQRLNRLIHDQSNWKTFIHTCGSVFDLIPDLIESGFDILNPVQCSAHGMAPDRLKQTFGDRIVFWGGGINTQQTMAFGSPDAVYREARERIDVFNQNGGFVFNSIHNIQADTPTENMLALFRAIRDSAA
ncbi:MAG: hypothetical protein JW829_11385 [Pirellulales bacterium]|nr:hypothetical protein [Pirellulales bacterium]